MLYKFAAGTVVASCLVALGGTAVLALRLLTGQRYYSIAAVWCLVPFLWGAWMVLAPQGWLEKRLPIWGAILGAVAALNGLYVVDLPQRVAGIVIPTALKPLAVLLAVAIFGALWIVVGKVYHALKPTLTVYRSSAAA